MLYPSELRGHSRRHSISNFFQVELHRSGFIHLICLETGSEPTIIDLQQLRDLESWEVSGIAESERDLISEYVDPGVEQYERNYRVRSASGLTQNTRFRS